MDGPVDVTFVDSYDSTEQNDATDTNSSGGGGTSAEPSSVRRRGGVGCGQCTNYDAYGGCYRCHNVCVCNLKVRHNFSAGGNAVIGGGLRVDTNLEVGTGGARIAGGLFVGSVTTDGDISTSGQLYGQVVHAGALHIGTQVVSGAVEALQAGVTKVVKVDAPGGAADTTLLLSAELLGGRRVEVACAHDTGTLTLDPNGATYFGSPVNIGYNNGGLYSGSTDSATFTVGSNGRALVTFVPVIPAVRAVWLVEPL